MPRKRRASDLVSEPNDHETTAKITATSTSTKSASTTSTTSTNTKDPSNENTAQNAIPNPPPAKRQRVSRACDQCRAAREKCDGIQPLCFPCASQNRRCSWEEPKKKRGVQTGYIRTLELALGWMFDKIPGSEDALLNLLTHEGGQGRVLLVGSGKETSNGGSSGDTSGGSNSGGGGGGGSGSGSGSGKETGSAAGVVGVGSRLHRRWMKSTVHKEIDRVLSGGDAAYTKADKPWPPGYDSESEDDGSKDKISNGNNSLDKQSQSNETSQNQNPPTINPPDPPPDQGGGATTRMLKLPSNYWHLLDIYFAYTHCWFPILEKTLVQKTCWLYPTDGLDMHCSHGGSGSHAELWAALALASYQDEASGLGDKCIMSPEDMYHTARGLIPHEDGNFHVRHVNALLLLALINMGRQDMTTAWILIGFANRIALSLGLHHQASSPSGGSRRSRHAYMACFILDTIVSTHLDCPPHCRSEDLQLSMSSGEDDQDEWESWIPCVGFGIQPQQSRASRSPSHAVSSFSSLYAIHRLLSWHIFSNPTRNIQSGSSEYLSQIQRLLTTGAVQTNTANPSHATTSVTSIAINTPTRPFNAFILAGGIPPVQVPSVYLLRLAFLCGGTRLKAFKGQMSLPLTVLLCLEEYITHFGICGIPPLFTIYMAFVSRHYSLERLTAEERARWRKVEAAVESVWRPKHDHITGGPGVGHRDSLSPGGIPSKSRAFSMSYSQPQQQHQKQKQQSPSSDATIGHFTPTAAGVTAIQQLLTPTSYYTDATPSDQPSTVVNDLYDPTHATATATATATAPAPGSGMMSYTDVSQQHYADPHPHGSRASFSSAAFDYDAILDDIASLDRTDRIESDSQFMANLGFLPGTDVLTHDFMGLS